MKYFCLTEKEGNAAVFLFPKELDDEGIKNDISIGLRNQTYGNWRRFQFIVLGYGEITEEILKSNLFKILEDGTAFGLLRKQFQENMKYICVSGEGDKEYIYVFPRFVHHDAMEEVISHMSYAMDSCHYEKLISAGFVNSNLECFGESETLGIPSRKDKDTNLLRQ